MTTLIFRAAGSLLGSAIGGPFGPLIGSAVGQLAGSFLTASGGSRIEGPRLADLSVQTSTYGKMIPIVYGTVRIAGNIIWSRPIMERRVSSRNSGGGGKGGGGRASQSSTSYSYSVDMAIAICEGEVTEVARVWADAKQLDLSQGTFRFYKGDETQLPDPFIESFEGIGSTPAYRGLAYVIVEDFPLEEFGNRIPNFTFEVKRKLTAPDIGMALTVLASGPSQLFDRVNSVDISLLGEAELESVSEIGVLNGANLALLGDELFQYTTATLLSPGKYRLGGLLRGRLGSEWAIETHAIAERFVLLSIGLTRDTAAQSILGLSRLYKPVSVGAGIATVTPVSYTYTGAALKPYAPVAVTGSRDGSGKLTIHWLRRSRLGGQWRDYVDVPLNEVTESYEVEILNGANVVCTLTGLSTSSASYTAAQQTTDFGSTQSSINVRVYQLSALIGRGYAAAAMV